jgi:hypothetical protein
VEKRLLLAIDVEGSAREVHCASTRNTRITWSSQVRQGEKDSSTFRKGSTRVVTSSNMAPPIRTFMDVSIGDAPPNRVIFELFVNQVPKTVEK